MKSLRFPEKYQEIKDEPHNLPLAHFLTQCEKILGITPKFLAWDKC